MISSLRNKKKLITFSLWFVIAAFVGTIFFVWGVGDKAQEAMYAAKVDGTVVSEQEFRNRLESTRNQFRQLFGNNIDELMKNVALEKTVMENLINEALLRSEADRLKIPVSDAEVAANIQSIQAFQTDGKFDQQRYIQLLSRNRLTPQIFEESVRRDMVLKKMEELIRQSVAVSDIEIEKEYVYRNAEATVRFLELKADEFVKDVAISDEKLQEFFEKSKENYRVPEKADFKYVVFNPETYKGDFQATDKEIETYFINNKASFNEPETVNAAHILLKVDSWDDDMAANKVYKRAKDIKEELNKGADFAETAKKYSEDGTSGNGGELGYFTRGQMVPEFEKAAFETEAGKISDVIKTQFGFHIVKVIDHKEERNPTLDEVKEAIAANIKQQKSASSFRTYVFDTYKAIVNKSNITAYNQDAENKLTVNDIRGLTAAGNIKPLVGLTDIADKLMRLNLSETSQVLDVNGLKMVFEMTEKYDSFIPELKSIDKKVLADYVRITSLELAQAKAAEASKLATMDGAAEKLSKSYVTTPKFKRNDPISGLGMNSKLMDDIFKADSDTFIKDSYTIGNRVFLVQVKDIFNPDVKDIDEQTKESIRSALFGTKSSAAVNSYIESLKSKSEIEINNRYLKFYSE